MYFICTYIYLKFTFFCEFVYNKRIGSSKNLCKGEEIYWFCKKEILELLSVLWDFYDIYFNNCDTNTIIQNQNNSFKYKVLMALNNVLIIYCQMCATIKQIQWFNCWFWLITSFIIKLTGATVDWLCRRNSISDIFS